MKTKNLINPFSVTVLVWAAVFLLYSLSWSSAMPALSAPMLIFFAFLFAVSGFFAVKLNRAKKRRMPDAAADGGAYDRFYNFHRHGLIVCAVLAAYLAEFAYNGGIPLVMILLKQPSRYAEFGIPTFHVLVTTFSSFYALYLFYKFLRDKKRKYLFFYLVIFSQFLLVFSRGQLVIAVISAFFCYLHGIKKIRVRIAVFAVIVGVVGLYLFGYTGNLRSFEGNGVTFLTASDATDSFINGIIPNEFFWTYSYGAMPLASFQTNVNAVTPVGGIDGFLKFIDTCIMPDFISKRIAFAPGVELKYEFLFSYFNVFTVYTAAYLCLGWFGVVLLVLFQTALIYIVERLLRKYCRQYYVIGMSLILTISIMNMFVNMWTFSGLSFQLFYPLLFGIIAYRKRKVREYASARRYALLGRKPFLNVSRSGGASR